MATSPMLQSVLLFQHHQTTTPNLPVSTSTATTRGIQAPEAIAAAKPKDDPTKEDDTEENGEDDNDDEEESGEEKNG